MSKTHSNVRTRMIRAGIATAAVTAAVATTISPAYAAAAVLTLNSTTGPSGSTTTTITASAATAWLTGVSLPVVTLSLPACQTTYNTTASTALTPSSATAGNVLGATATKISNTKAAILLPSLTVMPLTASTAKYNVCVYTGSTSTDTLIGTASYSVAGPSVLTSVSPASGPALGGSLITVTGTSFPTAAGSISATLGGMSMNNVTPISTTSFTATTPYHASGVVALGVTTAAGTVTLQSAFTYANGIVISPNTASNAVATAGSPVYADVNGSNFLGMTFAPAYTDGTNPAAAAVGGTAEVFLVSGGYEVSYATNGPIARCNIVAIISDSELICSMNLHTGKLLSTTGAVVSSSAPTGTVPNGTYTLTVVSDGAIGAVSPSITDISSGATFTVANY